MSLCIKDEQSSIAVAVNGRLYGLFLFEDQIRENADKSVSAIQQMLVNEYVILLSGDRQQTAEAFGSRAGIRQVFGDLMPEDKVRFVESYQKQGKRVCMVGDGINDAPDLAKASIGVAMGKSGTEFASETADVILMYDDLALIADFVEMSRCVVKRIKWNIFFSIVFNLVGIAFFLYIPQSIPRGPRHFFIRHISISFPNRLQKDTLHRFYALWKA